MTRRRTLAATMLAVAAIAATSVVDWPTKLIWNATASAPIGFYTVEPADALERDSRGRALPVWQGCRRIADGEVFLMNTAVADSLDGRYFGALPAREIIGKATPLYTDEAGDGRFVWRAATH